MSTGPAVVAVNQTSVTVTTPFLAYDWAITVAWASSDLDSFKPASAPLAPSDTPPATASAAPTGGLSSRPRLAASTLSPTGAISSHPVTGSPPITGSPSSPTSAGGLSTTGKVGIGTGIGLGCPLILLLLALFVLMRRKKRQNQEAARVVEYGDETPGLQLSASDISAAVPTQGSLRQGKQYQYTYPEMEGAGLGQQYEFVKPELEVPKYGQQYRSTRVELDGG